MTASATPGLQRTLPLLGLHPLPLHFFSRPSGLPTGPMDPHPSPAPSPPLCPLRFFVISLCHVPHLTTVCPPFPNFVTLGPCPNGPSVYCLETVAFSPPPQVFSGPDPVLSLFPSLQSFPSFRGLDWSGACYPPSLVNAGPTK